MNEDLITRIFGEDGELDSPDEGLEEYKKRKKEAREKMIMLQNQPYEVKVRRSRLRAEEFMEQMRIRDKTAHVSVGGLDSITLHVFLKSIGINVPAVSVSSLEDKSIQRVHKALGVTILNPLKTKVEVLNEVGFPVISKRIAGKIALLQNPTENNKTVRHAIITGECGELGHFQKNSRMKLPQKWLNLFGGYENENEGVMYYKPNFKVSNNCCYWLKEKPCAHCTKNAVDNYEPMTNGDYIRSLSDADLAQIIMCPNEIGFDGNKCTGHCCECTRRWLEAERKVEE